MDGCVLFRLQFTPSPFEDHAGMGEKDDNPKDPIWPAAAAGRSSAPRPVGGGGTQKLGLT